MLTTGADVERLFLEWRAEDVWLPTGDVRRLLTLRLTWADDSPARTLDPADPWRDVAPVPERPRVVEIHWRQFPGPPVAWSAGWAEVGAEERRWVARTFLGECPAQAWPMAWAIASCAADATVQPGSPGTLPQRVAGPGWELDLVAWREGRGALPAPAQPLAALSRLPVVEWRPDGPAEGDLDAYPFAAMRQALAQDPQAGPWLAAHPDARVMQARQSWATAPGGTLADRAKGAPCRVHPAESVSGNEWSVAWLEERSALSGLVQQIAAGPGIRRVLDARTSTLDVEHVGGGLSTLAPSPERLAEQLRLIPQAFGGSVATISYDFLPGGAVAAVSRGTCQRDALTGQQVYAGSFLTFENGTASSTLTFRKDWDRHVLPEGLVSVGEAAPAPAGPAVPAGLRDVPPSAALAAAVAFAAAAAFLYSRIHRGDALSQSKRARIYAFVQAHPGRSVQEIARALSLARTTVEHHLRTLDRTGFVTIHDGPHGKAVRARDTSLSPYEPLLQREHARELLDLVRSHPGQAQQDLAARLGMRKGHLSQLVRELETAGLVVRRRNGRRQEVHPAHVGNDA